MVAGAGHATSANVVQWGRCVRSRVGAVGPPALRGASWQVARHSGWGGSECTVRQKVHYDDEPKAWTADEPKSECTVRQKVHYDKHGVLHSGW